MNGLVYFKPSGLVRSTSSVIPGFCGGGIGFSYPTIPNSLLWVDYANSCTDASGATPATAGDRVQTIRLPVGWGASLGDGLVRQDVALSKPRYDAGGLYNFLNVTFMLLPATINLSGAFTAYFVINHNNIAYPHAVQSISGNAGTYGGVLADFNSSNLRCYSDDAVTYIQSVSYTPATLCMVRIRRTSGNAMYFAATGLAEVSKGSTTYTWSLDRIMMRGGSVSEFTAQGVYHNQWVIIGADTVTDGTDAVIQAALIAKTPGLTGI